VIANLGFFAIRASQVHARRPLSKSISDLQEVSARCAVRSMDRSSTIRARRSWSRSIQETAFRRADVFGAHNAGVSGEPDRRASLAHG
jgi:hypothetical protein